MIVRWPGKVRAGKTDDFVWAFWDVMPTLVELAGARCPDGLDGISVAPRLLRQPQEPSDRFLYWERQRGNKGGLPPWSVAVRVGNWKAVRNKPQAPLELYDLKTDIGEQHDVATQHPDVVKRIEVYLKTARTTSRAYPPQEPSWGYPPLRTGYVR